MPLEDVVETLAQQGAPLPVDANPSGSVPAFSISCEYPDNLESPGRGSRTGDRFYRQNIGYRGRKATAEENVEFWTRPGLPGRPFYPNRLVAVGVGLFSRRGAGIVGGAGVAREPEQYATLAEDVMNHPAPYAGASALLISAAIAISYFDRQTFRGHQVDPT